MKRISALLLTVVFAMMSACSSTSSQTTGKSSAQNSTSVTQSSAKQFTVTLVRSSEKAQVIFMQDDTGQEYNTINPYDSPNYMNIEPGATVVITPLEIIKTPRSYMVLPNSEGIRMVR